MQVETVTVGCACRPSTHTHTHAHTHTHIHTHIHSHTDIHLQNTSSLTYVYTVHTKRYKPKVQKITCVSEVAGFLESQKISMAKMVTAS